MEANSSSDTPVDIGDYARVYGLAEKTTDEKETFVIAEVIKPIEGSLELLSHLMKIESCCVCKEKLFSGVPIPPLDPNSIQDFLPQNNFDDEESECDCNCDIGNSFGAEELEGDHDFDAEGLEDDHGIKNHQGLWLHGCGSWEMGHKTICSAIPEG